MVNDTGLLFESRTSCWVATRRLRCAAQACNRPITSEPAVTGTPRRVRPSSVIASRSIASVLTRRRPWTRRCSVTWGGFNSRTCQPGGPRRAQHWPVIVPSGLHPNLDQRFTARQDRRDPGQRRGHTGRRHRHLDRSQQPMPLGVGHHRATQFLPTSTATATLEAATGAACAHTTPLRRASGAPRRG